MLPQKRVASLKRNKEWSLKISYTKEKHDRGRKNTFEMKVNGIRFVWDVFFSSLKHMGNFFLKLNIISLNEVQYNLRNARTEA